MRRCGLTIDRVSMPLDLERMLAEVNGRLKGNKALDPGRLQGRRSGWHRDPFQSEPLW